MRYGDASEPGRELKCLSANGATLVTLHGCGEHVIQVVLPDVDHYPSLSDDLQTNLTGELFSIPKELTTSPLQ